MTKTNTNNEIVFDFKKYTENPLKIVTKKSYKNTLFLTIGLSLFVTTGLFTASSIHNYLSLKNNLETTQNATLMKEIKTLNDDGFNSLIKFVMDNSNVFDEKVSFIQTIIANSEIENYGNSIVTSRARDLGDCLTTYKQNLIENSEKLHIIRQKILSGNHINKQDYSFFNSYLIAYQTKSTIHDEQLDGFMNKLVFSSYKGNNIYNNKNHVYEKIKQLDTEINNHFNVIINDHQEIINTENKIDNNQLNQIKTNSKPIKP